jgi:Caspase domain
MRWFLITLLFGIASGPILTTRAVQAQPSPPTIYLGEPPYSLASRNALVVGVASVDDGSGFIDLKNPTRDAAAVSDALSARGFSVKNLNDVYTPQQLTKVNIKKALYDFALLLRATGGLGLIYFSGHGVERFGQQYLVPYDGYIRFDRDFDEDLIPLSLLYDTFAYAKNPLAIVVLDTCRDNPLNKALEAFGTQKLSPASFRDADNVLLANSTMSGKEAFDGSGNLSPYAQAFVSEMSEPDTGLSGFFWSVGLAVHQMLPNEQTPVLGQKPHEFIFFPTKTSFDREQAVYQTAKDRKVRSLLQQLIYAYPAGYFSKAAQIYLETGELAPENTPAPIATPASGPIAIPSPPAVGHRLAVGPGGLGQAVDPDTRTDLSLAAGRRTGAALEQRSATHRSYVKSGQLQPTPTEGSQQTIPLSFEEGQNSGAEVLDGKSSTAVSHLKDKLDVSTTKIEVRGFQPQTANSGKLVLLARQAAAVESLSATGFKPENITVSSLQTTDNKSANSVDLLVTVQSVSAPTEKTSAPVAHRGAKGPTRQSRH